MPDYRMDIKGKLGLGEYSDIYDYMGIVDKNDNPLEICKRINIILQK